jgi:dolichol kinase
MKELPRRLWHIFGGLSIPVAGLLMPPEIFFQDIFLLALVSITIAILILDIVRLRFPRVNRHFMIIFRALLRGREASTLNSSTYFLIAASIVFALCDKSIAAIALAFAAVGDPLAGMVGEWRAKQRVSSEEQKIAEAPRFPRNLRLRVMKGKSLEGSFACFGACLVVGVILAVVTHVVLWVVVVGAICATVIEFLSLPVNDNLSMPLVAAVVMQLGVIVV